MPLSDAKDVAALLETEERRVKALCEQDWDTLASLLAPNYSHTHVSGGNQDRATYLEAVRKNPRTLERGEIEVRPYGDVAVMLGRQMNFFERDGGRTVTQDIHVVQVWERHGDDWKLSAFQASGSPPEK